MTSKTDTQRKISARDNLLNERNALVENKNSLKCLFFAQVAETIDLDFTPSAIQIRFAGFKGVLALDPTLSGKTAVFRPSMRKFESPHRRLEVLQTSRPQPVFLNHQLIILLSSLGIPDEVFMNLQRRMLDRLAGKKETSTLRSILSFNSPGSLLIRVVIS